MKILFLCGRAIDYPRNKALQSALSSFGDVDLVAPNIKSRSIFYRSLLSTLVATQKMLKNHYDLIFIGFFGQFLMLPIGILKQAPILFDAFISAFDTLVYERQVIPQDSIFARLIFMLDRVSCNLSDRILLDTEAHIRYFVNTFDVLASKFDSLPVSCDETLFIPRETNTTSNNINILFYGSFLPIHGIDTIIRAAKLLENRAITFRIVGEGLKYKEIRTLANELMVNNVAFVSSLPLSYLPDEISNADICLGGHFGNFEKAKRVIAGKTYQCIAMAKPTIVGENEANRELLTHNHDSWFCEMGNHFALAEAVTRLTEDPNLRKKLGANARETYLKKASQNVLNSKVEKVIGKILV